MKTPKRISSVSNRNRASRAHYAEDARLMVQLAQSLGWKCPVVKQIYGREMRVEQVHHLRGRCGHLLNDRRGWMLVSQLGHDWIHLHISQARAHGWIAPSGHWNSRFLSGEPPMPGSVAELADK